MPGHFLKVMLMSHRHCFVLAYIEVQYREHYGGKWCRVSIGTIEEMQMFTKALQEITAQT